jgi:hypothetical protein
VSNALFSPNPTSVGLNELVSPPISLPPGQAQLVFRNNYDLEPGPGGSGFDGGVLEIKIGAGSFTDILAAGGSFLSGGYTGSIDTNYGNPLAGRQAWSGTSSGFITTTVNLPATASGQTIQLRWRCGTDSANGRSGWLVDTVAISNSGCLCCVTGTNAPALPLQPNRTINELSTLTVTNTATDADLPGDALFYTLVNPPAGASIDANGVISWTPNETQGPGTNVITTLVMDNAGLTATNSFAVIVNEVNSAPIFAAQTTRTINELATLTVTNTATDPDIPANPITNYQLLNPPAGASISVTGVITWTPTEAQGPGSYVIVTVATENGTPPMSATNSFTVNVNEVNTAPTLAVQSLRTVNELATLTVTNTATDLDLPADTLTYQLVAPPAGAAINSNGIFTWTPTGTQGPSTNIIKTIVTDGALSATNSFTVIVNDTATCQYTSIFQENFDGVTKPALPQGWTTTATGAQGAWSTTNTVVDTALNAAFCSAGANVGVSELVSTNIALPSGQSQLTFRHTYSLEASNTTSVGYDGGVLEIKIGAGLFTDIITAGGSFVSGSYDHTIDPGYSSPIAGRPAWSGTNGGYVTTSVTLPATAAGQNVQLKWRCASDNGNSSPGWRVDTVSVSNLVCAASNTAPVLSAQTNRTVAELTLLSVTNTATDSDLPANTLAYQLVAAPTGASINTNGLITWTPSEAQGPGIYTIATIVSDGSLNATNSFTVTVNEVNTAPVLPVQTNRTIAELTLLSVTNTATDSDLPANVLAYQLMTAPTGASINTNGLITWTPSEAQGPGSYAITTIVSDGSLNATNSFTVTVNEANTAPVLPVQTNRTVAELTLLSVTNAATDSDLPANLLTYQLLAPPGGATIDTNGVITWMPSEAQGPGTNLITTIVTDNGVPPLSATNSFTVIVNEVNNAPVLPVQTNRTINELAALTVTNTATDSDLPANLLSYQLVGPSGATIDTSGVITWTPTEAQGPSTNLITSIVTDNGVPPLSATNSFTVIVNEVNSAPVLPTQTNRTVTELATFTVTNTATDSDLPANQLSYQLVSPPAGATIDTNGVIAWTPSEVQGPGTNLITTIATDSGVPPLSATNTFTVIVNEMNSAPVLPAQTNRTVNELVTLTVTNTATDSDVPANLLSYQLVSPPAGATIDTNGVIAWTPSEVQGPGTNLITTIVTDNGVPPLSATNSFTLIVNEVNTPPVLPAQTNSVVDELTLLTVTNTATDSDIPANTLTYQLVASPAGMTINSNGVITWIPGEAQGAGTNLITTIVTDDGVPPLSATNTFTVVVYEVNSTPVLLAQTNQTVNELQLLSVTNTASDPDLPVNTLTYQLVSPPTGVSINTNGVITWTPTEAQGPSTNLITTIVTDNGVPPLSATNSFTVIVNEVNSAPVLPAQTNQIVNELTTLTVTNTASDSDLPTNTLTYELVSPPGGATIDANGVITWTPTEAQGPSTNLITTIVTDSGVPPQSATNTFTLIVNEVNTAPVLPVQTNRVVDGLTAVVIANTAADVDIPANTLTYTLLSPPDGAHISSNGIITWTPSGVQGASTIVFTTMVSDDGIPSPLSATNTFTVTVTEPAVPAPMILSIFFTNNVTTVRWTAAAGHNYRLEYSDGSTDTNWNGSLPAVLATGPTAAATNACGNATQRFYRVHLEP